jgi:hypothetical protein
MSHIFTILMIAVTLLLPYRATAFSGCADRVDCCTRPQMKFVGYINTPTCYKLLDGCNPWHCDKDDKRTVREKQCEWDKKCTEKYPKECGEYGCAANFPELGMDKGNCADGWVKCP